MVTQGLSSLCKGAHYTIQIVHCPVPTKHCWLFRFKLLFHIKVQARDGGWKEIYLRVPWSGFKIKNTCIVENVSFIADDYLINVQEREVN